MIDLATMGVTDEAIAVRATADYFLVAPRDQRLAEGEDGAFSPSARWDLTSTSTDFAISGIGLGSMVQIELPRSALGMGGKSVTRDKPDHLAVQTVTTDTLTFRRKGQLSPGAGAAPGPIAGVTQVKYLCVTVQPQVRDAARRLVLRYSLDTNPLHSPDDFSNAVICQVLADLYFAQARMAGDNADNFMAKYRSLQAEWKSITDNLDSRYSQSPDSQGMTYGTLRGRGRGRRWSEV